MMKRMNWHRSVIFLLVILFVMMTGSSLIAQTPGPGRGGRHPGRIRPVRPEGPCLLDQLTEEQQQELQALIEEMRADDATREEIHEAVIELLTSWGIEIPEGWEPRFGDRPGRPGRFEDPIWAQLSEEQRQQVMAKLKELRENEASREEVQTALVELFGSWGIELPENWVPRFHHRRHQGPGSGIMSRLTEYQRQMIRSTVRDMRADGATREEIHAAIIALLEEFGIEIPDGYGDYRGFEEPQKEQIVLKIKNRPNPFNPDTHISYTLTNSANVKLTVYNIQGQLVRSLVNEYQPAGDYAIYWDGCNQNGERVVSGMYIYQITAGSESISQQMIMMK